jgi:Flp pilus assembly protein TadG
MRILIVKLKNNQGAASVEMAIVLTLLLTITFGIMEYGWIFFRLQQLNNVTREAARIGALTGTTSDDVQNRVYTLMDSWNFDPADYSTEITPAEVSAQPPGTSVSVTITVPYSNIQLTGLVPTPSQLTSSATMSKEGP